MSLCERSRPRNQAAPAMKAFILKLAFVFAAIVGTTVFTMRVTRADQQGDSQWCHVCDESLLASGSIIEWD
jgi:hypothetical protein